MKEIIDDDSIITPFVFWLRRAPWDGLTPEARLAHDNKVQPAFKWLHEHPLIDQYRWIDKGTQTAIAFLNASDAMAFDAAFNFPRFEL
jgi:hypothetical protein